MGSFTIGRALTFGASLFLFVVHPTNAQLQAEWTWKDVNGHMHTEDEFYEVLRRNQEFEWSKGKLGVRADLSFAHLKGMPLESPDLTGAILFHADLTGADLVDAYLAGADLSSADLMGADLRLARLDRAIFEPKSLPELRGIAGAQNLELLTYNYRPDALVQLRKQFQDAGFRDQERKITYALKRRETQLSWNSCRSRKRLIAGFDKLDRPVFDQRATRAIVWSADSNLANCGSFVLNRVFFDLTCQYGMNPGRPLSLGVVLWLLCSILYFASIRTRGEAGLYRVYAQSIQDDPPRVERITLPALTQTRGVRRLLEVPRREWAVLRASMFFSLMSAFNIGFRDINFGRWLRLLTRQEFDMKAVGWARVVAGWQSLISVYFIALWVLTYFGRPFE